MAVRFSGTGQQYTRALSLGASTTMTICCWVKITTDRNAYSAFWAIQETSDEFVLQTDSDGTTLKLWLASAYAANVTRALTVGTWYFVAITISTTTGTAYTRSISDTAFTTQSWTGGVTSVDWTDLKIGSDASNEWLNGCVCAVKGWRAQLTAAEVQQEMWQHMPARLANLDFWYPLLKPETVDYSGNGRTLSGGSGTAFEDGPGIPWRQGRRARRRFVGVAVPEPDPGEPEALLAQITPSMGGWPGHL